ncbi:hypothetical protein ACF3OI_09815 (plasmid) [Finegoldia magna]|uniref:Uncharacterized protein n=1 Tax=Finegoldia dalianensis TaxID=3145239 RepID=A0ABW9KGQ9_9FIRM
MEELKITVNGKTYDVTRKENEDFILTGGQGIQIINATNVKIKDNDELIYDGYSTEGFLIWEDVVNPEIVEKILDQL